MRDFRDYIDRWFSTKATNLLGNTMMTAIVMAVTCYAVRKDVFDAFTATRSCLFAVLMCSVWSGLFNTIALFFSERDYLLDDLNKFLPVRVYISANFLIQVLLCLIEAIVSACIFSAFFSYDSTGALLSSRSIEFGITFFLVMLSADMLGFLVGMMINSITSIMTVIPVILIVQLLLSGCLFDLEGILEKAANFTTARWGFYALGSIADLNQFIEMAWFDEFRPDGDYIIYCWSYLMLLSVICILLSGIFLYWKINRVEN